MPVPAPLAPEVAAFYTAQTSFSDPGPFGEAYAALPADPGQLARVARGLVIHRLEGEHRNYAIPEDRLHHEAETRYLDDILRIILDRNGAPLTEERSNDDRFVGICRDFALLLCSFLRHAGIPARMRYGFADYFADDGFHADHAVTEYWDERRGWLLADANVATEPPAGIDPLDVPRDRFLTAGAAWRAVRAGEADPATFGVRTPEVTMAGEWFVSAVLCLDLAMLNGTEPLLWDVWGEDPTDDADLTDALRALNDRIAQLTDPEVDFAAARELYLTTPELRAPRTVLSLASFLGPREVTLR
ncbi:transglutaminase domain-containing protein [Streptomyces sp. 3MP-14]|uniref:Transglutaminase domain-containing protein n=1 Tax=Streptomyces mimosae TaxID=2586635 RepID=A0A5N6AIT5_9ACTN|nr:MULTISPECIES: transglutaminase domain-containing protein [Streptomyces]KAB8168584.1 transglutaminase domain-containing protein [Streptomyces mimosae]KAB8178135.1 transglutaminase domain-containing protein [Streptomyces sp. 3MP-14]